MRGESEPSILMVDDDPHVLRSLRAALESHGYRVRSAPTGPIALEACASERPDVVLLDLALPGLDGVEVCRRLRSWSRVPIVVLSARVHESQKVQALDAGADDYVTKPFGMDELLARLRASVRRRSAGDGAAPSVETPHFTIDLATRRVTTPNGSVRLTPTEWHVVEVLLRHRGKLVTQKQLLQEVWGPRYENETNYLRVFMAQIRAKLEPNPAAPLYFITEPGIGYRLEIED